jgi:hypothetical protein
MTADLGAPTRERYGTPAQVRGGDALRRLGLRGTVHPDDVVAFLYPTQEAADAFAAANREHYGHPDLGSFPVPGGVIGVSDMRHCLRVVTDPAKPDGKWESHYLGIPEGD